VPQTQPTSPARQQPQPSPWRSRVAWGFWIVGSDSVGHSHSGEGQNQ
jgi:hypothetical protein